MRNFFRIIAILSILTLAGCACSGVPETLPTGSIPLVDGYAPVVKPQPVVAKATPAPVYKKRTYTKRRPVTRKAAPKKTVVKKATTKRRVVRRTVRPTPRQVVPPIPLPVEEAPQDAGRIPERLQ